MVFESSRDNLGTGNSGVLSVSCTTTSGTLELFDALRVSRDCASFPLRDDGLKKFRSWWSGPMTVSGVSGSLSSSIVSAHAESGVDLPPP